MKNNFIDKIFEGLNIPYKETRFNKPKSDTYCIYTDYYERGGGDNFNCLTNHHVYIELYSEYIDKESEESLESAMDSKNYKYIKSDRNWLEDLSKYQVIYDFNILIKD